MKALKIWTTLMLGLLGAGLTGCDNPVASVKEGRMNFDPGITVGAAFENYRYFQGLTWEKLQQSNGRNVVEARAAFAIDKLEPRQIAQRYFDLSGMNVDARNIDKAGMQEFENASRKFKAAMQEVRFSIRFSINPDASFAILPVTITSVKKGGQPIRDTLSDEHSLLVIQDIYANKPQAVVVGAIVTY